MDDDLLLLIPRPVQEELDHLKQDGNSRRAKRARKASAFLRDLVFSSDDTITLQEHDPKIKISFSPTIPSGRVTSPLLDMSRSDDRILAEILTYVHEHQSSRVALLTHDTYPMLTAKRLNLEFVDIPEEWFLPAELDDRDKRISELEKRLSQYERLAPIITTSVTNENGAITADIRFVVQTYPDLSSEQIEGLLAMARKRHPMATDFGPAVRTRSTATPRTLASIDLLDVYGGYNWTYQAPSKEIIAKYRETEYPAWEEKLKSLFQKLPVFLEPPSRRATVVFIIDNKGSVPAENIVVEFEALGEIIFEPATWHDKDRAISKEISLPVPPEPPKGAWVQKPLDTAFSRAAFLAEQINSRARDAALPHSLYSAGDFLSDKTFLRPPTMPPPRDRNEFYWKNGKPSKPASKWIFECAEFRHQVDSEDFSLPLFIRKENLSDKGAIACTITAKNLPEPVRVVVPILIGYLQCDTLGAAIALIEAS